MSVSNKTPYASYVANGVTTVFPYNFYIIAAGDLQVSIDGVLATGFSVSGVGSQTGGQVTFTAPPAKDALVLLERVVSTARLTDYQDNGDLPAATLNRDFDRIWMAIQRASINLDLCLKRPLLGGPYDANPYRIENLEEPVNPSDATTKNYVDVHGSNYFARSLRVPENSVDILPTAGFRANRVLTFNKFGQPVATAPYPGSAENVFIELAKDTGATLVGATPEGTVQAALDNCVRRDGDEMTGALTVSVDGPQITLENISVGGANFVAGRGQDGTIIWDIGRLTAGLNDVTWGNARAGNSILMDSGGNILVRPGPNGAINLSNNTTVSGSLNVTGSLLVGDGSPIDPAALDETGDITGSVWNGTLSAYIANQMSTVQNGVVQSVQLGAESALVAPDSEDIPSGCVVTWVDSGDIAEGFKYKPVQIQINGTWATIAG